MLLFFGLVGLLGYNFFNKCSSYGGFMGIISRCNCVGVEIPHPMDLISQNQIPGGSSTMCIGWQTRD